MTTNHDMTAYLAAHGIKPSAQRIAVARYLKEHLTHPTVDEIYTGLIADYPTLSRTTVYNTVKLLVDNGCIAGIDIDCQGTRFDSNTSPHAHFLCTACGKILDISLDTAPSVPVGFRVHSVQLGYKGLCPACAAQSGTNSKN